MGNWRLLTLNFFLLSNVTECHCRRCYGYYSRINPLESCSGTMIRFEEDHCRRIFQVDCPFIVWQSYGFSWIQNDICNDSSGAICYSCFCQNVLSNHCFHPHSDLHSVIKFPRAWSSIAAIFTHMLSDISSSVFVCLSSELMIYLLFPVSSQCLATAASFHRSRTLWRGIIKMALLHGCFEKSGAWHPSLVKTSLCTSCRSSSVQFPILSLLSISIQVSSFTLIWSLRITTVSNCLYTSWPRSAQGLLVPGQLLVFESPVRSRSFALSALDQDQDRSSQFQNLQKTEPDLCRPVFCGLLRLQDRSKPVQTRTGSQLV